METNLEKFITRVYENRGNGIWKALQVPNKQITRCCFKKVEPRCDKHAHYHLDPASVSVASALGVLEGESVLDLCAAPGGKTLILAESLGQKGTLVANEYSTPRRQRLLRVIQEHVPKAYQSQIRVTAKDGIEFGLKYKEHFDKALVDVPCSSERHLLERNLLDTWSEKRSKFLSKKQYSLLASAFNALKPGGAIVYSTCSLSPWENDEVILRLLKKYAGKVVLDLLEGKSLENMDRTECGFIALPDQFQSGPMYFSRLHKCE